MKSSLFIILLFCILSISAFPINKENSHGLFLAGDENTNQIILRFDFGNGPTEKGYQRITTRDIYTKEKKSGIVSNSPVKSIERKGSNNIINDFISSQDPFYFVVDVPEGNYEIKIGFGDPEGESTTTVKAESRRLMLKNINTEFGITTSKTILVNIRSPKINRNEKIKLKPREFDYLNWDNKLSLEFSNKNPCISFIEIRKLEKVRTLFLAGNSTVVDQEKVPWASWGQMITNFLKSQIVVANFAESGEALLSFKIENRLNKILSLMQKDDYLFIEFAHNDQKPGAAHLDAFTTYKDQLKYYIYKTKELGGIPVLVTSIHRRKFDLNGNIVNTLGNYPAAVRQVSLETNTPLIDLNLMSKKLFEALGPEGSKKAFVHFAKGTYPGQTEDLKDDTHFSNYGAYQLAKCIVEQIRTSNLEIKNYLHDNIKEFNPSIPDPFDSFYLPESSKIDFLKPDEN